MTCENQLIASPDTFIAEMNHRRNSEKQPRITAVTDEEVRKREEEEWDRCSCLTGESAGRDKQNAKSGFTHEKTKAQ